MRRPANTTTAWPVRTGAAVMIVAALSACGGGNTSHPLSKDRYIKEANAICADSDARIKAVERAPESASTTEKIKVYDEILSLSKDELHKLQSLTPPDADKSTISGLLTLFDSGIVQLTRVRDAAARGDANGYRAASTAATSLIHEANQIATDYGLDICGRAS